MKINKICITLIMVACSCTATINAFYKRKPKVTQAQTLSVHTDGVQTDIATTQPLTNVMPEKPMVVQPLEVQAPQASADKNQDIVIVTQELPVIEELKTSAMPNLLAIENELTVLRTTQEQAIKDLNSQLQQQKTMISRLEDRLDVTEEKAFKASKSLTQAQTSINKLQKKIEALEQKLAAATDDVQEQKDLLQDKGFAKGDWSKVQELSHINLRAPVLVD